MYTITERRTVDLERLEETTERARSEYFPKLQAAPGFVGFYLVADDKSNIFHRDQRLGEQSSRRGLRRHDEQLAQGARGIWTQPGVRQSR